MNKKPLNYNKIEWFLYKNKEFKEFCLLVFFCSFYFFFHYYFTSVVKFTFMPVRTVVQVNFAGSGVFCKLRNYCFVVCSALISSCGRLSSLWMCHFLIILFDER